MFEDVEQEFELEMIEDPITNQDNDDLEDKTTRGRRLSRRLTLSRVSNCKQLYNYDMQTGIPNLRILLGSLLHLFNFMFSVLVSIKSITQFVLNSISSLLL